MLHTTSENFRVRVVKFSFCLTKRVSLAINLRKIFFRFANSVAILRIDGDFGHSPQQVDCWEFSPKYNEPSVA